MGSTLLHRAAPSEAVTREVRHTLGCFALAVIVGMPAGTIFRFLGDWGETRVADWIDLFTPIAVVGLGGLAVSRVGASPRTWALFGAGAVIFTLGHGIHLAANSVSNAPDPVLKNADIVHLWDEVVSHYLWYSGLFVILAAMAWAMREVHVHLGAVGSVLAVLFTVTLVNIYIEGAIAWLGLGFLAVGLTVGMAWRPAPISPLLTLIGGLGMVLLLTWGVAWFVVDGSVFPEFSDVGWI